MQCRYIDTHAHLYDEAFSSDFDDIIEKVKNAGIEYCIFPAIDIENYERQTAAAHRCRGFVFEAMGLHPTSVGANWREELAFVEKMLAERNGEEWQVERNEEVAGDEKRGCESVGKGTGYIAIGEIGIDGYWSKEFIEEQKFVFKEQLLLAHKYDLPVIVHVRDGIEEVFQVLDSLDGIKIRGVFHAFSGSYETYERLKKHGDIKIGIGGVVTYKNAGIAKVLERVPLEDILLETDSPYLTPVPYRGKRNDSSYIPIIAEKIAQIKGCSLEEVAEVTTASAKQMFGL